MYAVQYAPIGSVPKDPPWKAETLYAAMGCVIDSVFSSIRYGPRADRQRPLRINTVDFRVMTELETEAEMWRHDPQWPAEGDVWKITIETESTNPEQTHTIYITREEEGRCVPYGRIYTREFNHESADDDGDDDGEYDDDEGDGDGW